jgi:uncharacterized protein (DUF2236 family)
MRTSSLVFVILSWAVSTRAAVLELPDLPAVPGEPAAVAALPAIGELSESAQPALAAAEAVSGRLALPPLRAPGLAAAPLQRETEGIAAARPDQAAAELGRVFDRFSPPKAPEEGLFGPDSMMWRISGHHIGRIGGFAALSSQAAHPLVAEASKFSRQLLQDPHRRMMRTMVLIERILFADRRTALEAARLVNLRHAEVSGVLEEPVGRFPAGTPFAATDPQLLKWVLATTYHHTLHYYETLVRKLSEEERERYYQETKYFGRLLGLTEKNMPARHAEFDAWIEQALQGPDLAVGGTARALTSRFMQLPKLPWPAGPLAKLSVDTLFRVVFGLLPERIREMNGLPWSWADRLLFPIQLRMTQKLVAATPDALLLTPAHLKARLRVRMARLLR